MAWHGKQLKFENRWKLTRASSASLSAVWQVLRKAQTPSSSALRETSWHMCHMSHIDNPIKLRYFHYRWQACEPIMELFPYHHGRSIFKTFHKLSFGPLSCRRHIFSRYFRSRRCGCWHGSTGKHFVSACIHYQWQTLLIFDSHPDSHPDSQPFTYLVGIWTCRYCPRTVRYHEACAGDIIGFPIIATVLFWIVA